MTEYLSLAKTINVAQVFLPSDVMDSIDKLDLDLNTAADTLTEKTSDNSDKVKKVFSIVYVFLKFGNTIYLMKGYTESQVFNGLILSSLLQAFCFNCRSSSNAFPSCDRSS